MAQILPGADEYLSRGIKDLGDTLTTFFETDRKTQRGIRNMFLEKPELVQEFVDLEKRSPGSLKRLGFGKVADSLTGMPESAKSVLDKVNKRKGDLVNETMDTMPGQTRKDLGRTLAGAPTEKEEQVTTLEQDTKITGLDDATLEEIAQYFVTGKGTLGPDKMRTATEHWAQVKERIDQINPPESASSSRLKAESELEGLALGAAEQLAETVDFPNPNEIYEQLRIAKPDANEGELRKAAFDASQKWLLAGSPKTAEERRLKSYYVTVAPAVEKMTELENTGKGKWTSKMDDAISELAVRGAVWAGAGGMLTTGGVGTTGGVTSTDLPSKMLSRSMIKNMTPEEQEYFNNTLRFVEGILRPRTGLRIEPKEFGNYVNSYIPRDGEATESKNSKREARFGVTEQLREDAKIRPDYLEKMKAKYDAQVPPLDPEIEAQQILDSLLEENDNEPQKAAGSLMKGIVDNFSLGKPPTELLPRVGALLQKFLGLDQSRKNLEVVPKDESGVIQNQLNKLKMQQDILRGKKQPPTKPDKNAITPKEYINALNQQLIKLNSELPNAKTVEERDKIGRGIAGIEGELERLKAKQQ